MLDKASLYINGAWRSGAAQQEIINPATEQPIGVSAIGSGQDVEDAIAAARTAFDEGPWGKMDRFQRSAMIAQLRDALRARRDDVIEAAVQEAGAPRSTAAQYHFDIPMGHFDYFIEAARRDPRSSLPVVVTDKPDGTSMLGGSVLIREPIGVVAAISAYNQPFYINVQKIGPSLAMGNTVVLKPSPLTPLAAMIVAEAVDEVGFPPGVFNLVIGDAEVGVPLSSDPRIDMVTFTGSEAVGAAVSAQAAPTMKRVQLELGGKSALIVRADADLELAAGIALGSLTAMAGQGCSLVTRHIVHADVAEEFTERLASAAAALAVGDPSELATQVGPLISDAQRSRVEGFISRAQDDGARLVTGGGRPGDLDRGYFVQPTVFAGVDNRSELAQMEVFGPVLAVTEFHTDEEAVSLANDSQYGLGGAICSADTGRAFRMAERIRTGQVLINGGSGLTAASDPFGGYKRSGLGRERGEIGLDEYTETKVIKFHAG
jgi:aldehyde dehydrogenase (NAD+)